MYKLYYIRGINRLDTPYFSTLQEQATYFESKKILEIDYIYPPHYRDTIDFDITDLDMKTQANYLSIKFNNKMYYYFIDNVVYINEEMVQITVTMDVIQTYMFDIDYIHCDVARRTIDRWNDDGTINRNYLRENLSQGTMEFINHNTEEEDVMWAIIRFTFVKRYVNGSRVELSDTLGHPITTYSIQYNQAILNNRILTSDSDIALIPISNKKMHIINGVRTWDINSNENIGFYLRKIGSMENVLSIRLVPYTFLNGITYATNNDTINITMDTNFYYLLEQVIQKGAAEENDVKIKCICVATLHDPINILTKRSDFDFDFYKNNWIQEPFDRQFVPALLDENYIQYNYGEKISLTGAPLYQWKQPYMYSKYSYDLINGYRIYYNTDDLTEVRDKYKTLIYVTTDENYTLYNNAWNTYLSQNQATLTRGVRLNHIKNIYDVIPNITKNISTGNVGGAIANVADTAFNIFNINEKLNITKENLQFTPDTIKLGNAVNVDISSDSIIPCYYLYQVNDIDKVAEQYEAYGYKVNEHYSKVNILEALNTRYYYNVIKCEDMEINLKVLNDELTITRIKDRFNSGLRLWNIKNLDTNIQMGDLFVYDNVENKYLE